MMNGAAFTTGDTVHGDGDGLHSSASTLDITHALQVIYDSRSDNLTRQKASEYLDSLKSSSWAAQVGHRLAGDKSQPAVVQHFGLSLLEHSVRHSWHHFSDAQVLELRGWILSLSQGVKSNDPGYLRNKIAQLFVELAKKDWAISWYDMDTALLAFWDQDPTHRELVLTVLESLSEDVFIRDDSAAGLRGHDLHNAVVEIFTPASDVAGGQIKSRKHLRANPDGWLLRISRFLSSAPLQQAPDQAEIKACTCKALACLRSAFAWIMGPAITHTSCMKSIFTTLMTSDPDIQKVAIEALHSLYGRTHLSDEEFSLLVVPTFQSEVSLFRRLYESSAVDCHDIEATKYTCSKKFSETIAFIAGHVEERPASKLAGVDLLPFFQFMVSVTQHKSLVVSIPVLHSWVKILKSQRTGNLEAVWSVVGPLLDMASQRIIRYELFPEDSDEPSIVFLNEDIDTIPERHAFLGNYRRFCYQIIEIVAQRKPTDAISHLLPQIDASLDQISAETPALDPASYQKSSASLLRLDAHLTVVEAALKGYSKWVLDHGQDPPKDEQERSFLESNIETWASGLLTRKYEDPLMKQRIIKLAVECSARALERNQAFALKVLEHTLLTQTHDQPEYPAYSEAVRELQVYATSELRRLAYRHADYFATFYDQLEAKIQEIVSSSSLDEKAEAEMYGALMIVLQRASQVNLAVREERLQTLTESFLRGWQSDRLDRSLSSFEAFSQSLGLDRVGPYLVSKQVREVEDWSSVPLDPSGLSIQSDMNDFVSHIPLRITKTALGAMTDRLGVGSQAYQIAVGIWSSRIPRLLPKLLRLVEYAHRLHDPESWPNVPPDAQVVIRRVLQDRFWQAGISSGSRDDFYSRVINTKASLEGFASFVRGKIRLIREACYQILHSMSRLNEHFYGNAELPRPLADSLIASSNHLSSHQFSVLLQMVKCMAEDCPPAHRQHFLPPTLSTLFHGIDYKVTSEWERIDPRKANNTGEQGLGVEMKEESILRQLTYTAVNFVAILLDPLRNQDQQSSDPHKQTQAQVQVQAQDSRHRQQSRRTTLRDFILATPTILEPLILFATHMLTIPDSRSTATIAKVLRTVVPAFAALSSPDDPTTAAIREYMAGPVLKAAITSLNDGYFADLQKELASLIATIWVAFGCVTHFPAASTPTPSNSTGAGPHEAAGTVVNTPAYDRPPLTQTPRDTMASLPGLTAERVDSVAAALTTTGGVGGQVRQQRALVLDLLDGLRGVRISELGKIESVSDRDAARTRLQERYMRMEAQEQEQEQNQGRGQGRVRGGGDEMGQEGMDGVEGKGAGNLEDGPDLEGVRQLFG